MSTSRIGPASGGAGRIFYAGVMVVALVIGALQMARVRGGAVTDYGADVFGTAWLYAMFRQGRMIFQRGRTADAPNATPYTRPSKTLCRPTGVMIYRVVTTPGSVTPRAGLAALWADSATARHESAAPTEPPTAVIVIGYPVAGGGGVGTLVPRNGEGRVTSR